MLTKDLLDNTCMEPPETPAPMFAVRAFKHALFGTPQPVARDHTIRTLKKMKELEESKDASKQEMDTMKNPTLEKPEESSRPSSPTKPGILLTPGTIRMRRKEVTFGVQVVDNEGKKPSRSGIPNNCPGKFPSPWTPKTVDAPEEKRPKTKLTEELYSARATGTSPKKPKITRARDDGDITMDMMEPRSESGRYWKEQYMLYSQKSEEETKKLIAKQKLAKEYARKKDTEATDYRRQLELERNRRRGKEASLKDEVKDLREHLRKALAENLQTSTELALLKQQLEKSTPKQGDTTTSAPQHTTTSNALDDNFSQVLEAARTKSTNIPLSKSPDIPDALWEDAAVIDEEHSRVLHPYDIHASLVQSRGERARQSRSQNPRRLSRKSGVIGRTDSFLSPAKRKEDIAIFDAPSESTAPSGPATNTAKQSTRRTLGERNPNIVVSAPASPSKSTVVEETAGNNSKLFDPSIFLESFNAEAFDTGVFDAGATMEALSLQAEQPTTPNSPAKESSRNQSVTPVPSSRKHQRTHAKVLSTATNIPGDRAAAAKVRLEERRAARSRGKENSRISR
jgi:hypothetical protein